MCRASRRLWTESPLAGSSALCRHHRLGDRSTPRPRLPGRFSTYHPPRDGVRLQYKTSARAGGLHRGPSAASLAVTLRWQQLKPRSRRLSFREETAMSDWTMDRRAFLEQATVSGSVAAVGAVLPGLARGVSRPTAPVAAPFELEEATIAGLQAGLESGKYTARSLVAAYLQRIEELDRKGPALRALLEANPDALAQAGALDAERKAKGPRGPLHGIPVLVKDNIATRDRMQSTAGSLALAGVDTRDEATAASAGRSRTDYAKVLDPAGLQGARLGVCRSRFMGYSSATDALMEDAIDALKHHGAVIVDPADIATAGQFDESEFAVLLYEFKADLNKYLGEWAPAAAAKTLEELIAFNERTKEKEMPYFGQEIFIQAQAKGPLTDQDYLRALDKNHLLARTQGIDTVMAEHQLDALIAPTAGPAALIDLVNGDPGGGGSFSSPAAVAGYPHVTVPMGHVRGLPVGLSFVGRPWTEAVLLKLAFAYEQATKARRPPRFVPTAPLG